MIREFSVKAGAMSLSKDFGVSSMSRLFVFDKYHDHSSLADRGE
jgi:hypothetical protein